MLETIEDYHLLIEDLAEMPESERFGYTQKLCREDLFFLLWYACGRLHLEHQWLLERCRDVQHAPNGYLDLWSREHCKSSIITFGKTIQDIICDCEVTIGIFSHTRPIAKSFLRQIMRELENNQILKKHFPAILYENPRKESPKWSEDEGLMVIRKGNPVECTVEAWGMVDGMPTGRHFKLRVYDDVVTMASVTSREQIDKTTEAWELSDNLGVAGGAVRMIGTRYNLADTYSTVMERGAAIPRIYPATDDGRMDGTPVLFSQKEWERRLKTQSRQTIAAQLLQNPLADEDAVFRVDWLKPYDVVPQILNVAILCDPSKGASQDSDNTAIVVIGISITGNKYLLDGYCHHMKLTQRWEAIRDLYETWGRRKGVLRVEVGYEQYGMVSDDQYFEERMRIEKIRFPIKILSWTREGTRGEQGKRARVERLEPEFRNGRFYIPLNVWRDGKAQTWRVDKGKVVWSEFIDFTKTQRSAMEAGAGDQVCKAIKRYNEERKVYDLTAKFIEEYTTFPFGRWKDCIDAVSRIQDMGMYPPQLMRKEDGESKTYWDS